jgi:hypothetical protein
MIEADRVFSTPPLSTPIDTSRRRFLTVAAGTSIAYVGTLAVAAMPAGAPGSPACAADPIFGSSRRTAKPRSRVMRPGLRSSDCRSLLPRRWGHATSWC